MTELININFNNEEPRVDGRELHKALKVETPYRTWFPRMCEYGFEEVKDFRTNLCESTGGRPSTNHLLSISMAKEICMLQRTEIGREFRKYFIKVEEQWNSPEAIMSRALKIANVKLIELEKNYKVLAEKVDLQNQQILEMQPKVSYYDIVLSCSDSLPITVIAKDYGISAKEFNKLLHGLNIQFKKGNVWLLYQRYAKQGYTKTKTFSYKDSVGNNRCKVHTYWTQKGRLFIYEQLKKEGILPQVEKEEQDYE